VGPFLTIQRHAVVDLRRPWDPTRVIQEYLDDPAVRQQLTLSDDQLSTLANDGIQVRVDATHGGMGAMAGEMHIAVQDPLTVTVDIDAWATVRWWLRPFALPFRRRVRRAIDRQIDQLIEDLTTDIDEVALGFDDHPAESAPEFADAAALAREPSPARESSNTLKGLTWTLQVLTVGGELVYQHTQHGV
jgi:hypothetical protein